MTKTMLSVATADSNYQFTIKIASHAAAANE